MRVYKYHIFATVYVLSSDVKCGKSSKHPTTPPWPLPRYGKPIWRKATEHAGVVHLGLFQVENEATNLASFGHIFTEMTYESYEYPMNYIFEQISTTEADFVHQE